MALVRAELDVHAPLTQLATRTEVLEAVALVPEDAVHPVLGREPESLAQGAPHDRLLVAGALHREPDRATDPAARLGVPVVVDDQRALASGAVRVGEDVLVDVPGRGDQVVQQEVAHLGEEVPAVQQREELPLVASHQPVVGLLVPVGAAVLHPVLLGVALHLAVPEHRQPRQGGHEGGDPEVLVAGPELVDGRALVRVVHEVHVPLQDLRVELQRVAHHAPVVRVLLVAQHVHERAVVDPVHPERPDEVPLHQPERLGQEQRVRRLRGHAVDHLAPELDRHPLVELGPRQAVLGPGGDGASGAGLGEPEPLVVLLGQRHRRVEADHREAAGDRQDGLDRRLPDVGPQVVELRRVVPGHARAVVAVVDEAVLAGRPVLPPEDHRRVAVVVVVVLDPDADPRIGGEVRAAERVRRVRRLLEREEPVRVLHHPARVDPHVVGDHVAREPDPATPGALPQVRVRRLAAQVLGDPVVEQRVGGGHGLRVPAQLLDPFRRAAALPQPDQPEPGEALAGQPVQLLVGDLVQPPDLPPVLAGELVEPDVGALGQQHQARHPVAIHAEALRLQLLVPELVDAHPPAPRGGLQLLAAVEAEPEGALLLAEHVQPEREPAVEPPGQQHSPALPDVAQLARQRLGRGDRRTAEHLHQRLPLRPERRPGQEMVPDRLHERGVSRLAGQRTVVEQLAERLERGVDVGQPEVQQLLQRDLPVRQALGAAGHPGLGRDLRSVDRHRGEPAHEPEQRGVHRVRAEAGIEHGEGAGQGPRVLLLPVQGRDVVEDLVHQPHGVELAGHHRPLGMGGGVTHQVHGAGQLAGGPEIGEDHVPAEREEGIADAVAVARLARDVELHQGRA